MLALALIHQYPMHASAAWLAAHGPVQSMDEAATEAMQAEDPAACARAPAAVELPHVRVNVLPLYREDMFCAFSEVEIGEAADFDQLQPLQSQVGWGYLFMRMLVCG